MQLYRKISIKRPVRKGKYFLAPSRTNPTPPTTTTTHQSHPFDETPAVIHWE